MFLIIQMLVVDWATAFLIAPNYYSQILEDGLYKQRDYALYIGKLGYKDREPKSN